MMLQSNTRCWAGNRACGGFSQDVQFDSFGSQKTRIGRLEKKKPHLLIKIKEKIGEIRTFQTLESYHTMFQSNTRCRDPPGIELAVVFLKTSNSIVLRVSKNENWMSWEKKKPHPPIHCLNQTTRRKSETSRLFRQWKLSYGRNHLFREMPIKCRWSITRCPPIFDSLFFQASEVLSG